MNFDLTQDVLGPASLDDLDVSRSGRDVGDERVA